MRQFAYENVPFSLHALYKPDRPVKINFEIINHRTKIININ